MKTPSQQEHLQHLQQLNDELQTELVLVNQIKVDLSSEMVEFISWFCEFTEVDMTGVDAIGMWQIVKAKLEIEKAGGVH